MLTTSKMLLMMMVMMIMMMVYGGDDDMVMMMTMMMMMSMKANLQQNHWNQNQNQEMASSPYFLARHAEYL